MKAFWILFRKEFRFLAGPGIAMIVILTFSRFFWDFLLLGTYQKVIPSWGIYQAYIARYFVIPVISRPFLIREYLYAVMFLYAILYEHTTQSKYQLFITPVHRWTHIAAKYCAIMAWGLITIPILWYLSPFMKTLISYDEISWLQIFSLTTQILSICSIVMLGYVVAVSLKRFPFVTGTATVVAGYLFREWMLKRANFYFGDMFHFSPETMVRMSPIVSWKWPVAYGVTALVLCTVSFVLYDRFSEV